jgi:ABC-type multidrug transport system fused ATPase/permease subunit
MRFLLRCLAYFKPDLPRIIWSLVLTFLATLVALLQPFVVTVLFDNILGKQPPAGRVAKLFLAVLPEGDWKGQILGLAILGLLVTIVGGLLTMWQTMAAVKVGYYGLMRVRCELFEKLQQLSLAYHRARPQGDSIYRLSYDTYGLQTILNIVVGNFLVSAVMLLVMAWILFSMNWELALLSMVAVPLLVLTHKWSQKTLTRKWEDAKEADMDLLTSIQRSIASLWLTQAFGRERDEYGRFQGAVGGTVRLMLRVHWREVIYTLAVTTILGLGTALILGYGGYLAYRDQILPGGLGAAGMTVGKLYFFWACLNKFYEPLNKLTGSGSTLAQGAVQSRRVFEVLDTEPAVRDAPGAIPLPRQARTLELRDLQFEYFPGQPVLRGISATITPGEMVAFVGSSGVGKSTLLNLLPRFYDPTGGALLLDGHDLRTVKLADLRKHIALVLQENPLLPASVAENIAYGRPDANETEVARYSRMAGADGFIEALPDKYGTPINENGNNLSGGQRQRIAIARALITEAPILILDEPTSALDATNEQMVTETLRGLKRQRTIILVSHRLSTVADCDQIYVMDEGRIIERGTHEELLAGRGLYYRMARHQMKLGDEDGEEEDLRLPAAEENGQPLATPAAASPEAV